MPGIYGIVGPSPEEAVEWRDLLIARALAAGRPAGRSVTSGRLAALVVPRHANGGDLVAASGPGGRNWLLIQGRVYGAAGVTWDRPRPLRHVAGELLGSEEPARALTRLAGKFAAVLWDGHTETLSLVSDRFGSAPLYYSRGSGWFAFAPQASLLTTIPGTDSGCDPVGVAELLTFGYMLRDRSSYRRVRLLMPATRLTHRGGTTEAEPYWELSFGETAGGTHEELLRESRRRIRTAIRRCLEPGETTCVPLSGGLDSRMIAAEAIRHLEELDTYTYGTPSCHDQIYAAAVAARLGTRHRRRVLEPGYLPVVAERFTAMTDGMVSLAHSSDFPALLEEAGLNQVLLSGYLGDPLAGSHLQRGRAGWARTASKSDLRERLLAKHVRELDLTTLGRIWPEARAEVVAQVKGDVERTVEDALRCNAPRHVGQYFDFRERQRRMVLPIMSLADRFLECRLPFTDYDLVDFYLGLPAEHRLRQRLWIETLSAEYPEVAGVPWQATNARPQAGAAMRWLRRSELYALYGVKRCLELSSRGRRSFDLRRLWAPYDRWFRQDLRPWVVSRTRVLGRRDGVDPRELKRFVARHLSGRTNHSFALAALLTLSYVSQAGGGGAGGNDA